MSDPLILPRHWFRWMRIFLYWCFLLGVSMLVNALPLASIPLVLGLSLQAWVLLSVWLWVVVATLIGVLQRLTHTITLAKNDITIAQGLWGKKTITLPLTQIERIACQQSLWSRCMGFGSIVCHLSQTTQTLTYIENPMRWMKEIRVYQDDICSRGK